MGRNSEEGEKTETHLLKKCHETSSRAAHVPGVLRTTCVPDPFTRYLTTTDCSAGRRLCVCRVGAKCASPLPTPGTCKARDNSTTRRARRPKCSSYWRFSRENTPAEQRCRVSHKHPPAGLRLGGTPSACLDHTQALDNSCYMRNVRWLENGRRNGLERPVIHYKLQQCRPFNSEAQMPAPTGPERPNDGPAEI